MKDTTMNTGAASLSDEQILEHFEMPGLNLEATLDAHDIGLLLTGIRSLLATPTPQADAAPMSRDQLADLIEGMEVSVDVSTDEHDAGNRIFGTITEAMDNPGSKHGVILLVQNNIERNFDEPAAAIAAGGAQEADVFEWLETELSAISCRYHGDPSYDHDAYWMKERVMKLIADARKAFPLPREAETGAVTELKRIAHELRTYNPAADEYKGEHIHKVWAREIEALLTAASNGESK